MDSMHTPGAQPHCAPNNIPLAVHLPSNEGKKIAALCGYLKEILGSVRNR